MSCTFYNLLQSHASELRKCFYQSLKMSSSAPFYNTVLNLTKQAGKLIRERISQLNKNVETKSCEIDFVTETDQEVEKLLIDGLKQAFPDHQFIGEESVSSGEQCNLTEIPTWIIDPVDGTMNFVHGFPHSCISIALFIDRQPEIGIIYNPMLEQLFTARKGEGAFLNGKPIKVSQQQNLSNSLVMLENGTSRDSEKLKIILENQNILLPQVHGTRSLGSCALNMAMVAMGAADAYFEFGIHIWDIAAGELIINEAGGVVVDPAGGPIDRMSRRMLCAGSSALAEEISQKIVQYYPQPRD
ncbi:inositol monophosphatase 1 [Agrilus planipennis]|uniref:Inositol-1-monophosphatase n=1 Tax=Agrilus planipennis TaxID=224129 RepID=A0A1W4XTE6_AGRPL|nr:inositol monophosphatase 1 [Agrilus planipennis]